MPQVLFSHTPNLCCVIPSIIFPYMLFLTCGQLNTGEKLHVCETLTLLSCSDFSMSLSSVSKYLSIPAFFLKGMHVFSEFLLLSLSLKQALLILEVWLA